MASPFFRRRHRAVASIAQSLPPSVGRSFGRSASVLTPPRNADRGAICLPSSPQCSRLQRRRRRRRPRKSRRIISFRQIPCELRTASSVRSVTLAQGDCRPRSSRRTETGAGGPETGGRHRPARGERSVRGGREGGREGGPRPPLEIAPLGVTGRQRMRNVTAHDSAPSLGWWQGKANEAEQQTDRPAGDSSVNHKPIF